MFHSRVVGSLTVVLRPHVCYSLPASQAIPLVAAILHVDWLDGRTLGDWH
jgi:hypothetical protein